MGHQVHCIYDPEKEAQPELSKIAEMTDGDRESTSGAGIFLPAWWIRTYESAVCCSENSAEGQGLDSQQRAGALLPTLTPAESVVLAGLIGLIQQKILGADWAGKIEIGIAEISRFIAQSGGDGALVRRLLNVLPMLRLPHFGEQEGTHFHTWLPFQGEAWQQDRLTLELVPGGEEFFLGFSCAFGDALRADRSEPELLRLVGTEAPLFVWRSLWFDLGDVERAVYLRLERAMEWDGRWLRLDGIFAQSVAGLFAGLAPESGQGDLVSATGFVSKLQILNLLAERLVEFGQVVPPSFESSLVPSQREDDLQIIWQMSAERLGDECNSQYRHRVCGFFWSTARLHLQDYLNLFCWRAAAKGTPVFSQRLLKVCSVLSEAELQGKIGSIPLGGPLFPGQLILTPLLLLEWMCRSQPDHPLPLPKNVLASKYYGPLERLLAGDEDVVFCIQQFLEMAVEDDFFCRLREEELWSLASRVSRKLPTVEAFFQQQRRQSKFVAGEGPQPSTVASVTEIPTEKPLPELEMRALAPLPPPKPSAGLDQLRKVAMDELKLLRQSSMEEYAKLKKNYLESLEGPAKKAIIDVERRMQPRLFDEQIAQRLVKYMIDHPTSWKSARKSGTGLMPGGRLSLN